MSDTRIKRAIRLYLQGRHELLQLGKLYPERIGGNDNIIGRIGEFTALRFLEGQGQRPRKHSKSSNPGYDLRQGRRWTQVKVITEENQNGRNVRLKKPWTQFVLVELGADYECARIGLLTARQHRKALLENKGWSPSPIVKRTMLSENGLIGRYGRVFQRREFAV